MAALRLSLTLALAILPSCLAARQQVVAGANPIRKVVTMLQAMQAKVTEEGEKEKELYEKFVCYCKSNGGDLSSSISNGEAKISTLGTQIKEAEEQKEQKSDELSQAQADRSDAKATMKEATAIREKEAAAYAAKKADDNANIAAIAKAVAALEKGMAGAFLQTGAAQLLRGLASDREMLPEEERQQLAAFLSSGYAPQSGQVTGILKQMSDEMGADLASATAAEEAAIKAYEELMAAKKKQVGALNAAIETKLKKIGDLGVAIAQMKNDLTDTEEALVADREFKANLQKTCATKKAEWEERVKTRADELVTLSETIKVLNDDDALELFKKTLPSASASFAQVEESAAALRQRALQALRVRTAGERNVRLDFIELALRGKKIGFEKVIKMIDEMVATLKTEQEDDDKKKEYCGVSLDQADDKKKALERTASDEETAIENAEEGIATLAEEIAALQAGISALDKSVAEATAQRKEEHVEFSDLMASDSAAKELLNFAKNRLNKFYNPKLYKPPAKRELATEDRIAVNLGGGTAPPTPAPAGIAGTGIAVLAQVSSHAQRRDAPPPPPETFDAYTKKSEENMGVIAMMNLLIKDLDKEMAEAETEEKDAQADYVVLMQDSAEKRSTDSKSLSMKEATKADLKADLEAHKEGKASAGKELGATLEYIHSLHTDCDWLLKYFDARKEARAGEVDALGKAKAVLSGSDYALLQTRSRGMLRRAA